MKQKEITYRVTETGCWECTSHYCTDRHYPIIGRNGKTENLSRYMYKKYIGEIPQGHLIRHKCDNPKCINPDHLETGTDYDNVHDMIERGRNKFTKLKDENRNKFISEDIQGEKNFNAKLNEDTVIKILERLNNGEKQKDVAKEYKIFPSTISKIVRQITWTQIDISQFKNVKRIKNKTGGIG